MKVRHPGQLKKWKFWEPFWTYRLNSTANTAHLPQNWAKLACFAGSSKTAPRIFIFSIVLGSEYSSYVKSIATYVCPPKSWYNNSFLGGVATLCTANEALEYWWFDRLSHNTLIDLHTVFIIKTCLTSFDAIDRRIAIVCISCHPLSNLLSKNSALEESEFQELLFCIKCLSMCQDYG